MINIIEEYEKGRISFEELAEEIWGYGERLITEIGEQKFEYYVRLVCQHDETEIFNSNISKNT